MRAKRVSQRGFDFSKSHLSITKQYYAKYQAVSTVLDQVPELVELIHRDVGKTLKNVNREGRRRGRPYAYTSEHVLRILICQVVEGDSLRGIVVRIDDSNFLRRFVRIDDGPMMDYTTLCNLKNAIRPETWKAVNRGLAEHAVRCELIDGERLRLDTTAVETNIHWPTDSTLLWDVYRTLDRLIRQAREIDPEAVGSRRLQARRAKRLQQKINRRAANKGRSAQQLKPLYTQLIRMVEDLFDWARSVRKELARAGDLPMSWTWPRPRRSSSRSITIWCWASGSWIRRDDESSKASVCGMTRNCLASSSRTPNCSSVARPARTLSSVT